LDYNKGMTHPKPDDRQKNCLGKLTWDTQLLAQAARAYASWQHGDNQRTKPYQCKYCHKWHLARQFLAEFED
jgi:hypothetical protein